MPKAAQRDTKDGAMVFGRARPAVTWQRRVAGALRVAGVLCILAGVLAYVAVRSVHAEMQRSVRALGERLATELGPSLIGEPQELLINGQQLFVSTRHSALSVAQVLDRFAASCAARTDGPPPLAPLQPRPVDRVLLDLDRATARHAGRQALPPLLDSLLHDPARLAIVRQQGASAGQLACLAHPTRRGLGAFLARVRDFIASGDLSVLGTVRYAAAHQLDNGETRVLAVWSEGELRIDALFPASGDAPGSDLPHVPRPPSATRKLCVTAPGRGGALRLYDSALPPRQVLAFYERELPARGWQRLPTMIEGGTLRGGAHVRAFTRDGQAIALGLGAASAGNTEVSLLDLGAVRQSAASGRGLAF